MEYGFLGWRNLGRVLGCAAGCAWFWPGRVARRLLTFDERHFRALRSLDGGQFALFPADLADP
jgi:hypothetical protein